jgi:phosphoesterase RecJ-like protein
MINLIKSAESIVIFGHKNPDGDALGAVLAMGHFIRNEFGKMPVLAFEGVIPDNLRSLISGWWLKKAEDLIADPKRQENGFDLAVMLDTASAATQLGDDGRLLFEKAAKRIKIDHHQHSIEEADVNIIGPFAATCEMLAGIAAEGDWRITPPIARFLYAGIYTDTGGFVHDYTTPDTMRTAAKLMEFGARPHEIVRKIGERMRITFLNNAETLGRTRFTEDGKIGYVSYSVKKIGEDDRPHREGGWLHQQILTVKDLEVSAVFKELDDGSLHVSLRGKTVPINKFAESFGGGGHNLAAAFTMDGPIDAAVGIVISKLAEFLSESDKTRLE